MKLFLRQTFSKTCFKKANRERRTFSKTCFKKTNREISVFSRLGKFLTFGKKELFIFKALIGSQFKYFPLRLVFHSVQTNKTTNKLH